MIPKTETGIEIETRTKIVIGIRIAEIVQGPEIAGNDLDREAGTNGLDPGAVKNMLENDPGQHQEKRNQNLVDERPPYIGMFLHLDLSIYHLSNIKPCKVSFTWMCGWY